MAAHVFLPFIAVVQPLVYLTEIFFTVALSLGLFVCFSPLVALLFTVILWIGLYNDPTEWPWTYVAIIIAHGMFITREAGRSLALDALMRQTPPRFARQRTRFAQTFWLAT